MERATIRKPYRVQVEVPEALYDKYRNTLREKGVLKMGWLAGIGPINTSLFIIVLKKFLSGEIKLEDVLHEAKKDSQGL